MYYYIFEPPLEAKGYERTAQIKELLGTLGIAGEMNTPTPGRGVEDLVQLAIAKRYSTIIAVGGVELINRVARALEPHEVVFGIIPLVENPDITKLIGVSDWKQAAEQLKRRRWHEVRLGLINSHICFLTPATIEVPTEVHYSLHTPDYSLKVQGGSIMVTPVRALEESAGSLEVTLITPAPTPKKNWSLFAKKTPEVPRESHFTVKELEIKTSQPLSLKVAGSELATTPVYFQPQQKAVRLIIAKSPTETD